MNMKEKEFKIEQLLEEVYLLEEEIREEENSLYTADDIQEMRHAVFAEIEICNTEQAELDKRKFWAYGREEYSDEIKGNIKAALDSGDQSQVYQYALNAAAVCVDWLCWMRAHPQE